MQRLKILMMEYILYRVEENSEKPKEFDTEFKYLLKQHENKKKGVTNRFGKIVVEMLQCNISIRLNNGNFIELLW